MKARTISPRLCVCTDKKQTTSAMVIDTVAELTASNIAENRRSCKPQIVLTNEAKPSTTIANSSAIFNNNTQLSELNACDEENPERT